MSKSNRIIIIEPNTTFPIIDFGKILDAKFPVIIINKTQLKPITTGTSKILIPKLFPYWYSPKKNEKFTPIISTLNPNKKIKSSLIRNFFSIELLTTVKNKEIVRTYGVDERKNSFWSDNIPKNPLIFTSQTIKIEKYLNSLLSRSFSILVY